MHKLNIILFLFWILPGALKAQNELQRLHTKVSNPFIKPEEIDALLPAIKRIVPVVADSIQQRFLFETYQLAAYRYETNNHFKQAYLLYQDYLALKEKTLVKEKANAIMNTKVQFEKKQSEIILSVKNLKNEITTLEANEVSLNSRNKSFVRNVSLIIILFSSIFIMVFFRLTWKLKKLREEVEVSHNKMLSLEKTALIGSMKDALEKISLKRMEATKQEISSLRALLKHTQAGSGKEQTGSLKKLLDGYSLAEGNMKTLVPDA